MKAKLVKETLNENIYGDPYVSHTTGGKYEEPEDNSDFLDGNWTLNPGDQVTFKIRGMELEFEDVMDEQELHIALSHNNEKATVISPETASKVGERDYEYYNIRFKNGDILTGISGYHLV